MRFTEFVRLDGKEFGLYIMEEPDLFSFKIQIFTPSELLSIILKKEGESWAIVSTGSPLWINELVPAITSTIKRRFFVELD